MGLDVMVARPAASLSADRAEAQARLSRATMATLAVAGVGAAVAARIPVVGSVVAIATNTLVRPNPVRAMIGAVAVALFPAAAIPICGFELLLIGHHVRRRGFVETASTILGLGLDASSRDNAVVGNGAAS